MVLSEFIFTSTLVWHRVTVAMEQLVCVAISFIDRPSSPQNGLSEYVDRSESHGMGCHGYIDESGYKDDWKSILKL